MAEVLNDVTEDINEELDAMGQGNPDSDEVVEIGDQK